MRTEWYFIWSLRILRAMMTVSDSSGGVLQENTARSISTCAAHQHPRNRQQGTWQLVLETLLWGLQHYCTSTAVNVKIFAILPLVGVHSCCSSIGVAAIPRGRRDDTCDHGLSTRSLRVKPPTSWAGKWKWRLQRSRKRKNTGPRL